MSLLLNNAFTNMTWINDKKFWIGLILGVAIGLIFPKFYSVDVSKSTTLQSQFSTTTPDVVTSSNQGAGDKVYVPTVSVSSTSWVAVRENNNDVIGRILGAQRLDPGTHENVLIDLLRPTTPQVMYAIVLYRDNGDGEFDPKTDQLLMESSGEPILSQFVAK